MFGNPRHLIRFVLLSATLAVLCHALVPSVVMAQGIVESATGGGIRQLSAGQMQAILPSRGPFSFGQPWNTQGIRVTNASDCGGADCVHYGYSYWPKINNSAGHSFMYVVVGLDKNRGGAGPSLFKVDKGSNQVTPLGPLFPGGSAWALNTAEYWYFSHTRSNTLYLNQPTTSTLQRFDVETKEFSTVFDIASRTDLFGSNKFIWQYHSSGDDRVHSATIKDGSSYAELGCMAYREDTNQFFYYRTKGLYFDECQIDKSGRYLVIKERVDPSSEVDNRIIDLDTGSERLLTDRNGAGGHSDNGYGYLVAADNYNNQPGAVRLWNLSMDMTGGEPVASVAGQGTLVYQTTNWATDIEHLSFANAKSGVPIAQQYVCGGGSNRQSLPRANEIVCFKLDGSLTTVAVAPNMVDMNASGGGDDYGKFPKGNIDPTGEYFLWTANAGSNRLDAFIVKIPVAQLGGNPSSSSSSSDSTSSSSNSGSSSNAGSSTSDNSSSSNTAPTTPTSPSNGCTTVLSPRFLSGKNLVPRASVKTATCSSGSSSSSSGSTSSPSPAPPSSVSGAVNVSWTSVVNASATGNNLMKSGGCGGCADAGAVSVQRIPSGDGYVEFTVTENAKLRFVGLSSGNNGTSPDEIKFALRLQGGVAEVRESGAYRSDVRFAAGDTFRVAISGGKVQYSKNGSVFYTSSSAPSYPALVDTSLLDDGAEVWNARMAGAR
jgi:hypothetical protein